MSGSTGGGQSTSGSAVRVPAGAYDTPLRSAALLMHGRSLGGGSACSVANMACPIWRRPVTLAGGIAIVNGSPAAASSGSKKPCPSHLCGGAAPAVFAARESSFRASAGSHSDAREAPKGNLGSASCPQR